MDTINILIEPRTIKFFIGLYLTWTAVTVCIFCDWYREKAMMYPNIKIKMSIAENINIWLWVIVTLFTIFMWVL